MTISKSDAENIERLANRLTAMSAGEVKRSVEDGGILNDSAFALWCEDGLGAFYAPFDWVNEEADVVLIGITPGKRQAADALLALRSALLAGKPIPEAAARAKETASFNGEVRAIAAELMDHFRLNEVFGLPRASMLFEGAAHRAHYTSVLRYPVIQQRKGRWGNYGGDERIVKLPPMRRTVEEKLIPELRLLPNAWLVPFVPVPALVLDELVRRGEIDPARVLSGLNHPSGTQWNRHNCQLDRADHRKCAPNVGCLTIQERSWSLRDRVGEILMNAAAPRN